MASNSTTTTKLPVQSLEIVDVDSKPKTAKKQKKQTHTTQKKKTVRVKKATTVKKQKTHTAPKKEDVVVAPLDSQKSLAALKREPLGHLLVEQALRKAGFGGGVTSDKAYLEQYSYDESIFSVRPQIILQPRNTRDVEIAVRVVAQNTKRFSSLSLTPRAAGTGLSGGSLTDSIVIDVTSHMNQSHDPTFKKEDVTITCQPGAMWNDIEKKLKIYRRCIPSYPASKDISTIGGAVANNAAGPDSLKGGHMAHWVASLDVTLYDGNTYTIAPLSYREYQTLAKKRNAHAEIARRIFTLIEKNEKSIMSAKPKTSKNSAGYALWNVLDTDVRSFKKGKGTFDLTQLISGSQGTIGIITSITLKTQPVVENTTLLVLPVFNLDCAGKSIMQALEYDPVNVEIFDDLTFDLALKNPEFFKQRIPILDYYKVMLSLYTTYHVRYNRKIPEFTLLVTLPDETIERIGRKSMAAALKDCGCPSVRFVKSPVERQMWWQVRRASYSLSKLQDTTKRPAAFLEDMTVPPEHLPKFFTDIKKLFKKYKITAAVHGHGGNGHFHFYPLLDFTKKETAILIEKMSEEFFTLAVKHGGSICGEHNDGIIRTPYLTKMFNKKIIGLFETVEHIFDPDDIFNPGKKVHPRFDVRDSLRKIN